MAVLDVPTRYLVNAPIIVSSPTTRCGTTLVQRLLSASDNAFVYGEEIGHQLMVLAGLFGAQLGHYEKSGAAPNQVFQDALAGRLEDWKPGLGPPTEVMLQAWVETYYQLPTALAAFGRSIGRPLWGFKWPGCPYDTMHLLLTLMPRAKLIYVLRGLEDALKSAKARRFVQSESEAEAFCARWSANMIAFCALRQNDRVLFLDYETLVANRLAQVHQLAEFAGVANIRPGELDLKINTFIGDTADGHAPNGYIEPQSLTDAEQVFAAAQTQTVTRYLAESISAPAP